MLINQPKPPRWSPLATALVCLCVQLAANGLSAQPADTTQPVDPVGRAAEKIYQENLAKYRNDPNMLVRPGLLANRSDKWVRIWARSTGLKSGEPLEFVLIPPDSGKDYEAVAVAYVKPSDVHIALEFIGMKGGRPVNYMKDQCWPKGERVIVQAEFSQQGKPVRVRAEDLIYNVQTKKALPHAGFVFTDSFWIDGQNGERIYAANETDSMSILSDYNERSTVLDVPLQAPQSTVYGMQKLNPAYQLPMGTPMQFTLEPEHKNGTLRVRDLSLRLSLPAGATSPQAGKYLLTDSAGKQVGRDESLLGLLASFWELTEAGQDPFVTLQVDDSTSLAGARQVYAMLMKLDNDQGIRIDAPPEGHLYYRAFFPKEEWRDRSKRLGRPWELHLAEKDHKTTGTLILPADEIEDNNGQGDLKWTVGSPDEAAKILAEKSNRFSQVVYVLAPATMRYGELMGFIRPAMKTHQFYVFLPKSE